MGKKSKKKVQWRRLSLNELQSNDNTSKRRQRKTPERDVKDGERSAWNARQPAQADHSTGTNKRGPPSAEELPDTRFHRPQQDDDFSNYNNHNANQRFGNNFYDRRFHNNGPHHNVNSNSGNDYHHVMNGAGIQNGIQQHERYEVSSYHCGYSNRAGMMDRSYRNFDRDRTRFYNNYQGAPFERYGRDGGCNGPNGPMVPNGPMGPNGLNGFYHDRLRPIYRMNGRPNNGYPLNYGSGGGSPSKHRRWSNGDEPACTFPPRNLSSYHNGNSSNPRYHDGSHCGNGHDSGGSSGYEGGSSETQSEPEERQPVHQPVQSILIDNDQYTKIQTPRQEVIFKKNSGGNGCPPCPTPPSRSQSLTADRSPHHKGDTSKRAGSTTTLSRNKKNRTEVSSASKLETNKSSSSNCSNKKQNLNRRGDGTQTKKGCNQAELARVRAGKENYSKPGDGGKVGNKKQLARTDGGAAPLKQNADDAQSDNLPVKEDDEDFCAESDEDEDEEELYHQEEYSYQQDYSYLQDMQAGVIMQQCYPGGPMVSIPVHWTSFLDPSLIPGDTALTPLDPAFTHLLDPSFKPLDPAKWDNLDPEAGPPNVMIPDTVIPVQHDASGCPVTVQVNVDENGVPIKIEPSAFTVQLSSLGQHHHHHPSCQMAGLDHGMPFHYAQYADGNRRNQYFEYNFDEGLEKRLEQKIDEELAKHYSDEEDDNTEKGDDTKTQKEERRDSRDCEEISYDSQYASMSEGSSLPTSPAGELSDSPSNCPPNTPSEADVGGRSTPSIMKSAATPVPDTSRNTFTSNLPAPTGSSISVSSASTLCSSSSSSSSTLVSLSSSPVNSGISSKETSPSSPRQASREEERFSTLSFHTDQQETDLSSDDAQRPNDQDKAQEENFHKPATSLPAVSNGSTLEGNTTGSMCNDVEEIKLVVHLSDDIDKCASKEKTTDCVTDKRAIEIPEFKTVVDKVNESILTTSVANHSSKGDVDHKGIEENDNPTSEIPLLKNLQENTLSTGDTATCAALNTVSAKTVSDANLAAVSNDYEDFDQLLVPDDSAASENVGPQSSPEGASDDAPPPPPLDGQGVTVTVKPGYVMVPILTPCCDPSVFYGYQMMSNEGHVDHSHYHGPHTSKKKKKKHNRRRGMDNNSLSYLDSDMYAGEPYVTTPDGYLMPMDASMCQYPVTGSLPFLHPMQQYQYEMLQQQLISQQYHQSSDEGFVSVEHSPFLPDTADSPVELTPDANQLTGGESKFGKLHETERQQIKDVLDDNKTPTIGDACGADLSDSGVSETEEVPRSTKTLLSESFVSDPVSCDTDERMVDQCDMLMNLTRPQSNILDSFATDKHEDDELESELSGKISSHLQTQNNHQPYGDDETNTIILAEMMSSSRSYRSSLTGTESPHNTSCSSDKDEVNSISEVKNDSYNSITQEIKSEESVCGSPNTLENIDGNLILKSSENIYCSLYANDIITGNDPAILICSSVSSQSELTQVSSTKTECEGCDEHFTDDECDFQNETAPSIQDSLNTTFDCKEISSTDNPRNNHSSSLVNEEVLLIDEQDKSDLSSDVSLNDGVTEAMVAELEQEMTLAQSLIDSRISSSITKRKALAEPSSPRNDFLALKDLKVTEAVRRWIREVTPEKAFTLHPEEIKSTLMDSRLSEASEDDEYFEDEVVDPGGAGQGKFLNQQIAVESMTKTDTNTEELSKNVRGNPFGVLCSDSNCSVKFTKGVATCSTSSDALDDYDGCSSISSLSPEPLFSPPSSQLISQFSSKTITPNHSLECDHEEVDLRACTCDPSGYRKYYQLAAEVDDSPVCSPRPMSPDETGSSTASKDSLLTTKILKAEVCAIHTPSHLESCIFPPNCNCSLSRPPIEPSSLEKALASSTSNCSSGLGSSLASTPVISPQHPPLHHPLSSPRLPFMLLPPNMRAESGSASLNTVPCCSLM